jgi:hypothetical protein
MEFCFATVFEALVAAAANGILILLYYYAAHTRTVIVFSIFNFQQNFSKILLAFLLKKYTYQKEATVAVTLKMSPPTIFAF